MSLALDIARCLDASCPRREECQRWTEPEGHWFQSTFRTGPNGICTSPKILLDSRDTPELH